MKFFAALRRKVPVESHPARGAWIEMERKNNMAAKNKSHPARGAWIEIEASISA